MSNENEAYLKQMDAWLKEQEALEKQIRTTIETSGEIVRQNEIQLQWHLKKVEGAKDEFATWKKENGYD